MLIAVLISILLVALTISVHFATFRMVSARLLRSDAPCYRGMTLAVAAISTAHVVEAGAFAAGFWSGDAIFGIGSFQTDQPMGWMDYFYFSLVNFTTLGRGDISPTEHLRFIAGMEAFVGFLMITASGSYVLQVMAGKPPAVGLRSGKD